MARNRPRVRSWVTRWLISTVVAATAAVLVAAAAGYTTSFDKRGGRRADTVAPLIISHRGYHAVCAENTACAAHAAAVRGADMVETDIRWSRDRLPVIMHDATVDRVTTGHGTVASMTAARFKRLTMRHGHGRPATLRELLTAAAPLTVLAELKTVPTPPQWAALQRAIPRGERDRVIIQSFHRPAVELARAAGYRTMLLAERPPSHADAPAYALHYTRLSARTIARLHAYGTQVYAWTPDTPTDWTRLAAAGVDGLITDADPRAVARALRPDVA